PPRTTAINSNSFQESRRYGRTGPEPITRLRAFLLRTAQKNPPVVQTINLYPLTRPCSFHRLSPPQHLPVRKLHVLLDQRQLLRRKHQRRRACRGLRPDRVARLRKSGHASQPVLGPDDALCVLRREQIAVPVAFDPVQQI